MAQLAAQARTILAAALQVVEALRLLCLGACTELVRWAVLHPYVMYTVIAVPTTWAVSAAFRRWVNLSWEHGLKDARTGRKYSKLGLDLMDFDADDDPEAESEDDGLAAAGSEIGARMRRSPTVTEKFLGARRGSSAPALVSCWTPLTVASAAGGVPCGATLAGTADPLTLLRQVRVLSDLEPDCLNFILKQRKVLSFKPGEPVFEQGKAREGFLVIRSGQVIVEACRVVGQTGRRGDEYTLQAGDTVVGLLFVLASLEAEVGGAAGPPPPEVCRLHSSSARAGGSGAEVVALPTEAFASAFDRFPFAMQSMVRRLCARNALVVSETLSTYFGLQQEILVPSTYSNLCGGVEDLPDLEPKEVFARLLGLGSRQKDVAERQKIDEVLAAATTLEMEEGQYAFPPQQRAMHLLVLLEGEVHMQKPGRRDSEGGRAAGGGSMTAFPSSMFNRQVSPAGPHQVNLGEAIGELSILIDRAAPVEYQCATRCRFAALPREAAQKLLELCPRAWCLRLLHLIAARTASWLHRVDAALDWLPVEGGQCLYRKGDPLVGFFVVLSGRLIALEEHLDPSVRKTSSVTAVHSRARRGGRMHWHVSDVLQRGRLCGELDCLRDSPYSQTVRASRDSEVCRVSPTVLHLIAMDFPKAILHFSSLVGPRSGAALSEEAKVLRSKTTIAVIPASADVDVQSVCVNLTSALNGLGKTLHISPDSDLAGPPGSKASAVRSVDGPRLGRLLAELEERCRWLVYEGEPPLRGEVTDWTRRCVRQADHILVATNFDGSSRGDVPETINERYVEEACPLHVETELLLLHAPTLGSSEDGFPQTRDDWFAAAAGAADALRPGVRGFVAHHTQLFLGSRRGRALRSTRHYLNVRPWARRWHHVRQREPRDWARCARLLAGRGIGLCLGGGGARGNCHFGVIRALRELGIPIDVVSGTSFGALAGAIYSMCVPEPGSMERLINSVMGQKFSTRKMLMDLNFPRTSYFTGFYLNSVLKDTFARRRCEDLLVPFACPSTDIVSFEAKMHREGPLWRIVRASMSLVGFVPPLPYQERRPEDGSLTSSLLVDGGYVNQYPIEVLKEHGAGTVICVVACPDYEPVNTDYGDVVRGGLVTLRRTCGCRRRSGPDPPTQAEIQERLMFLVESMKESHSSRSDLTIYPEIQAYGLLDFAKHREISEKGYVAAKPRLEEWLEGDSASAQHVRQAIESERLLKRPSKGLNEVEYGGRAQYGKWRAARRRASEFVEAVRREVAVAAARSDRESSPDSGGPRRGRRFRTFSAAGLRARSADG